MNQRLEELVESLTTSGEPELKAEPLKELKKICKSSDEHIRHVYHLLLTQLNQEHAEIRLSAFQIVGELFTRSHQFRTLLIDNFQEFLELTVETDYDQPLPPPKEVAQKMKTLAIKAVQEWHEKFGEAYKKLSLGFHFLKQRKMVDFQDVRSRTLAQRKREEEKQKRLENIYREKAKKAKTEMEEMLAEIQSCLTEMENCFKLLLPDPDEFNLLHEDTEHSRSTAGSSGSSQPKPNHVSPSRSCDVDDEQPCCSKDLPAVVLSGPSHENAEEETSEESDDDFEAVEESFIRDHGLGSHKYSLDIEISRDLKVNKNEDNTDVVNSLMDAHKLAKNKFWPSVQSWIQVFTKAGVTDDSLRCAIDLKNRLENAMKKNKEMKIDCMTREGKPVGASEDEDEDDFEEVPEKEGYEPHIPDHLRAEYGLEAPSTSSSSPLKKVEVKKPPQLLVAPRRKRNDNELDPTCAAATLKVMRDKLSSYASSSAEEPNSKNTKREEDLSKAPVVPFGIDLHYWGKDQPTAGKILKVTSQHRFWAASEMDEETENKELEAMLKTRYISFPGKFEPVKHKCRVPLPNGSLCERQDRIKCPFHGKIIPRDEIGVPINPEDREREVKEKFEQQAKEQDWRDPELMREIEQATGEDLSSMYVETPGKKTKRKGKKKKYPNLTDLKQKANTTRSRLEKKVFSPGSVKRAISAMNQMDKRRHEKFANQFNYALN
ncbi:LOW QUALITY PROTEIN: UV-stimulated scaffold protein A [Rana temporaria]|uniref:LOW QUALITY PROTEIN: UV-stimulated scaffold protein A n=1 Tax=Rana temporaria TaxID=8407 RepID=UPI001AADAEB9|nr:LOW QUALITY PROTEIN: UV-stimulated scaffold protein A [Rana temporaria]